LFAKDSDFVSLGAGKAYHPKLPPAYDGNLSWSKQALPYKNPCWNTADDSNATFQDGGLPCVFCPIDIAARLFPTKFNTTVANEFCNIDAYEDELSVWNAIQQLQTVPANKFFYLAVGMHKPHLPWMASKEDFAKHPLENVQVAKHRYPPVDVPQLALQFTEKQVHASPFDPLRNDSALFARRAYRATITGMDRKLKPLLDALKATGRTPNTAILFHSDHGYHLGELGEWRKFTNFELGTHVPLIIQVPWLQHQRQHVDSPVELIDLYPTIRDLSGVDLPVNEPPRDGNSLVPALVSSSNDFVGVASYALSQYPRRVTHLNETWKANSILHHDRSTFTHMGYTIRTTEWRYTEWCQWNGSSLMPIFETVWNTTVNELYDHRNEAVYPVDFDSDRETINVAKAYPTIAQKLSKIIRKNFPTR
jgi:iduronate 2-sulfatase